MRPARRQLLARAAGRSLLWAAALFGLCWFRYAMMAGVFRNSDDASNFLAGAEVAGGNPLLHGWILATDNYYLTDILLQAALTGLFGFHPALMQAAEAAIWGAIALLGCRLALRDAAPRHRPATAAIALGLLCFNMIDHGFGDSFLTTVASHGSTILLTLAAFALAAPADPARWRPGRRLLPLCALVAVGSLSDPIFNLIACLPMLLWSGLRPRRRREALALALALTVLAGMALGRLLLWAVARAGGFHDVGLAVSLADLPLLGRNLAFALGAMARLFGAAFTGGAVDGHALLHLSRLPFLLALAVCLAEGAAALLRRLRDWPGAGPATPGRAPAQALDQLLWLSLALCVAGTVMTTVIVDPTCARFFLPAAVAGSVLVARRFGGTPLFACYGLLMLPLWFAASLLTLPTHLRPSGSIAIPEETRLVRALRERGLTHGYAGFWEANMTTVLSRDRIRSLPLLGGADGRLHPLIWFDNLDWFADAAARWHGPLFFVVSTRPAGLELGREQVTRQFGPPAQRVTLGLYEIEIYDRGDGIPQALLP